MKRGPELLASLAFGAAILGVAGASAAQAGGAEGYDVPPASPEVLLDRMTRSLARTEYEGTLVYLHDHQLATLRIAHRIQDGVSRESLLALSGPIRAIARNDRGVTCMLPDSHPISMPRADGESVLRSGPFDFERLRRHYLLHLLGQSRVAGRDTDVVGIVPRDNYRYGYRYFIDRDTGLALKIDLMDNASEPIEQVMFTSVAIHASPAGDSDAAPPAQASILPHDADGNLSPAGNSVGEWQLSQLPPGFTIAVREQQPSSAGPDMQHIVVSDGLASVSVYIEPAGDDGLSGATRMGAINAVGRQIDGRQVTVVGEVPELTAQMLIDGVERVAR